MHRFFVRPLQIQSGYVELAQADTAHAARVLRMRAGDALCICDGENRSYDGVIEDITPKRVRVRLGTPREMHSEPPVYMILFQALIKGAKMETVLQKGVELGISKFIPFESVRSVVKAKEWHGRLERYQSIIRHAAMQSGRGILPEIVQPLDASSAAKAAEELDAVLLLNENTTGCSIKVALSKLKDVRSLGLVIGPEGGVAEAEAALFERYGARSVSLGPRILRTETAGMAAAAMVLYQMELG